MLFTPVGIKIIVQYIPDPTQQKADPKQTPGFCAISGSAMADPELTPSRHRKQTQFQKQTLKLLLKNDQMSLHVYLEYIRGRLSGGKKKEGPLHTSV